MNYTTIEADIAHGQVTVREPEKLPERGRGLLIVLPSVHEGALQHPQRRVRLPLIQGECKPVVNPTPEELDASLWD